MANLDKIKKRIMSSLKWPTEYVRYDKPKLSITSDPLAKKHMIRVPTAGSPVKEMDYMHELTHAWLGEKVHPFFSILFFRPKPPEADLRAIFAPYLTARDWFAGALLIAWCPKERSVDIIREVGNVIKRLETKGPLSGKDIYAISLVAAQAIYWGLKNIEARGDLKTIVNILLKFRPEQPTVSKLTALTNQLAPLTTRCRVRLHPDSKIDTWEVYQV